MMLRTQKQCNTTMSYWFSRNFLGTVTYMWVLSPFSLIQNRTGDFGAPFARLRRSALQPLPQCTASVLAVHCILHANTCNLSRKYLRPSLQVLATAPASTCGKRRHYIGISSPMFFYWAELFPYYKSEGYHWDTPHFIMYDYHSLSQMLWSLFSFVSAFPGSCGSSL